MAKQTFSTGQVLTSAQMTSLQANDFNMSVSTQTANYTLAAADKGTREVMNMSAAGTVTVPNSTFDAGDAVWLHSIGSGTISVVAGAGLTLNSSAGTAPTLAQWEGGVVYFTSASAAIFFRGGGTTYGVATGGTSSPITVGGVAYTMLTFTSSSTLTVTKSGLFDVLTVGGGGGGGQAANGYAAAGGGGGIAEQTIYLAANTSVTIGAGGAVGAIGGGNPSRIDTSRNSLTGVGGGCGASGGDRFRAGTGGCGGGGFGGGNANFSAAGVGYQGFNGGAGAGNDNEGSGGGGGGSAVGTAGSSTVGGNGGAGFDASAFRGETALTTRYAGGGGGGGASGGTGGSGGGGNRGSAGSANTGGGGGGGTALSGAGQAGGSGIVLVRFKV